MTWPTGHRISSLRAGVAVLCLAGFVAASCSSGSSSDGGDSIEVFSLYRGAEADHIVDSLADFTEQTGAEVRYIGSNDFTGDLLDRIYDIGDPPDVAIVPQPGLVESLVDDDRVVPVDAATSGQLRSNYDPDVIEAAEFDGVDYAVPFRRTLKSVVWFRPDVFESNGWEIPRTLDQLEALSAEIAATDDGIAPWCFSLLAGDSTGWSATDWIEDLVLRRTGPDVYDQWVTGQIEFSDERIADAFDEFQALVLAPGRVAGGITAVTTTPVDEAWQPLLAEPPGCAMYRQADFALEWMPDIDIGPDGALDWFILPDVTERPAPLLIGGDSAIAFNDRPEVAELMAYLAGPDTGLPWVEAGDFISAKSSIDASSYPDVNQRFIDILADADVQAFDGSDQMSPAIGSGVLWQQITDWVSGAIDYDELAETVDTATALPPDDD